VVRFNPPALTAMKITFPCRCGQRPLAREENAGKKVRCTYCAEVVRVPEVGKSDAELYALPSTADGIATRAETDLSAAAIREATPRHTYQTIDDRVVEDTSSHTADGATSQGGDLGRARVTGTHSRDAADSSWLRPSPPLPRESRSEPLRRSSQRMHVGCSAFFGPRQRGVRHKDWTSISELRQKPF
jgi:hypothetical protein